MLRPPGAMPGNRGRNYGRHDVSPVVRCSLYLFVFSLPFELPGLGLPFEVAAFTGSLFLLTTLLQPRVCYRPPPGAFWWFIAYVIVYILATLLCGVERKGDTVKAFLMLVQAVLLFWSCWCLMRYDGVAKQALLTFIAGCTLLAAVDLSRVAATVTETGDHERLSAFGQNPNKLGRMVAMGLLVLLGAAYGSDRSILRPRIFTWPLAVLLAACITDSGSRGSLVALMVGLFMFVFRRGAASLKLQMIIVVVLGIGLCIGLVSQSESTWARFERTAEEGSLAKREVLFPEAFRMFLDSPLVGWGPVSNMDELGSRVGERDHPRRDTHNLVLELLTATGMLGFITFMAGTCLCGWAAWKARHGALGILPFALLMALLVANMGANLLYTKLHWFVMSVTLAGAMQFTPAGSRRAAGKSQPADRPPPPGPRPARPLSSLP